MPNRLYIYRFPDRVGASPLATTGDVVSAQLVDGIWHVLVAEEDREPKDEAQEWPGTYGGLGGLAGLGGSSPMGAPGT